MGSEGESVGAVSAGTDARGGGMGRENCQEQSRSGGQGAGLGAREPLVAADL